MHLLATEHLRMPMNEAARYLLAPKLIATTIAIVATTCPFVASKAQSASNKSAALSAIQNATAKCAPVPWSSTRYNTCINQFGIKSGTTHELVRSASKLRDPNPMDYMTGKPDNSQSARLCAAAFPGESTKCLEYFQQHQ